MNNHKFALARRGLEMLGLMALACVFVFPFFWIVSTSFKTLMETAQYPPSLLPENFNPINYAVAFASNNFPRAGLNSLFIVLAILVLQMAVVLPASYALAFKKSRLEKPLFALILIGLMVPDQVTFLPVYLLFSKLKLINTYVPLVVPFAASAFGIFMVTQSFRQIPKDVIEAAKLDKSNSLKTIWKILLPSIRPTIICFALFSCITHWNDYFWPFAMTNQESLRTLPMAVAKLSSVDSIKQWHVIMAGNTMLILPLLLVYLLCSKWIKRAFAYNGIK
jgi:sn-glycerol 3-phosphate transport system permease protein